MKYKVTLNNKVYEVEVERGEAILLDEYDAAMPVPVQAPTANTTGDTAAMPAPVQQAATVSADGTVFPSPLPGTILSIKVKPGDTVKKGQIIFIIEAMKMENEVMSPSDCTITQIITSVGATVNTGDPLLVLSEGGR